MEYKRFVEIIGEIDVDHSTKVAEHSIAYQGEVEKSNRTPFVIVIFLFLLILMPIEFSFRIGSLFLPWYRVLLFFSTFYIFFRIYTEYGNLRIFDKLILAQGIWLIVCEAVKRGGYAFEPAASYFVETVTAYFLVRLLLKNPWQFKRFPNIIFLLLIPCVIVAFPEAVVIKQRFIHDFARSITHYSYFFQQDYRMGMLRAASFFEHPILFGLFCSSLISLTFLTARTNAAGVVKAGVLILGVVFFCIVCAFVNHDHANRPVDWRAYDPASTPPCDASRHS